MSWNPVYDADEYFIENTNTGWSKYIHSTSIIDDNPKEGENYYELSARGTYGWSEIVTASCYEPESSDGTSDLPAPTGFKITQTSSYVKLTWNKVSGATSYYVGRALETDEYFSIIEETKSTSYQDYDVKSGTTYYYAVAAVDSEGYGELATGYITFTGSSGGGNNPGGGDDNPGGGDDYPGGGDDNPGGGGGTTSTPSTPTNLQAEVYSSCIALSWNSVSGATKYNVYRSTSASGTYSNIKSTSSTYYDDCSVTAGTTYYYKVSAQNSAGESSKSSYAAAKVSSGSGGSGGGGGGSTNYAPCPPTVKCSGSSSVTISWTAATGTGCGKPTSYEVKRMNRITGQAEVLKSNTTSTSYTDSQPFPGINMYGVTATNDYGPATGQAMSSAIGIAAPNILSITGTKTELIVNIKDLNVPEEWKQYYTLEMYWKTTSSGSFAPEHTWKYKEFSSGINDQLPYYISFGDVNFTGKTFYYKFRWVFEAPHSPTRVDGSWSVEKTVKH